MKTFAQFRTDRLDEAWLKGVEKTIKSMDGVVHADISHFDDESHGWAAIRKGDERTARAIGKYLEPLMPHARMLNIGIVGQKNQYSDHTADELSREEAEQALGDLSELDVFYWSISARKSMVP